MLKGIVNRRRSLIAALILAASIPARGAVTVTAEADVVHLTNDVISVVADATGIQAFDAGADRAFIQAAWRINTASTLSAPLEIRIKNQSETRATVVLDQTTGGLQVIRTLTLEKGSGFFGLDIVCKIRAPEMQPSDNVSWDVFCLDEVNSLMCGLADGERKQATVPVGKVDLPTVQKLAGTVRQHYTIYKPLWMALLNGEGTGAGFLTSNPRAGSPDLSVDGKTGTLRIARYRPEVTSYWSRKRGQRDEFTCRFYRIRDGSVEPLVAEAHEVFAQQNREVAEQIREEGLPDKPTFTDEQVDRIQVEPVRVTMVERDSIRYATANGRGLLGAVKLVPNQSDAHLKCAYAQGINAVRNPNLHRHAPPTDVGTEEQVLEEAKRYSTMGFACSTQTNGAYYSTYQDTFSSVAQRWNIPDIADVDPRWTLKDGSRGWPRPRRTKVVDFYRDDVLAAVERIFTKAATTLAPVSPLWSFNVDNELWCGWTSYSDDADRKWGGHCRKLWQDDSPDTDTNGDGRTYNSVMGTDAGTWSEVRIPRDSKKIDHRHPSYSLLEHSFKSWNYAYFIDRMSEAVARIDSDLAYLSVHALKHSLLGSGDPSLEAAMPNTLGIASNSYRHTIPAIGAAIGAVHAKPYYFFEANGRPRNGYENTRWLLTTFLPFAKNMTLFAYAKQSNRRLLDPRYLSDWRTYSMINVVPGPMPVPELEDDWKWSDVADYPYKAEVLRYDKRMLAATEISPFITKVARPTASELLWLTSPVPMEEYSNNYVVDCHMVSDNCVTLLPDSIDFSRYRAIVYSNPRNPCSSNTLYDKLSAYVRDGGTVLVNAYWAGERPTITGASNRERFWATLKPGRDESQPVAGRTTAAYGNETYEMTGLWAHLKGTVPTGWTAVGTVRNSEGEEYPLLYLKPEGDGRWVMLNLAALYTMPHGWDQDSWPEKARSYMLPAWSEWYPRFGLLKRVVSDFAGVEMTDLAEVNAYQGDDCMVAYAGAGQNRDFSNVLLKYRTDADSVVAFDVFKRRLLGSGPIRVRKGTAEITVDLDRWLPAGIYVVKPTASPVLLYADGTVRYRGRYEDDAFENGRLRFPFCETAWVWTPREPQSVSTVGGEPLDFDYAENTGLLTVKGPGWEIEATVDCR
mgnify:CR=1 FL=1